MPGKETRGSQQHPRVKRALVAVCRLTLFSLLHSCSPFSYSDRAKILTLFSTFPDLLLEKATQWDIVVPQKIYNYTLIWALQMAHQFSHPLSTMTTTTLSPSDQVLCPSALSFWCHLLLAEEIESIRPELSQTWKSIPILIAKPTFTCCYIIGEFLFLRSTPLFHALDSTFFCLYRDFPLSVSPLNWIFPLKS